MALDYVRSNTRLTLELDQVSKEATRVAETLRGINLMPHSFPVEAMTEICISLANLTNGTAEGCVEPLNFARHMLPLVRRDHFYIEGEEPEPNGEDDIYFTREHMLDQAITRLYVAVGTALDEYRSQAQDKYDDQVGAEEILEFSKDGTFAQVDSASRELAQEAERETQNLSALAAPNSENADSLKRQIQDSANLSHSVQSQIRIRPVVARWYETVSAALSKLPDVLIKTADQMRLGVDIVKICAEEWSAFKRRLRHLAYEQIDGLANALEATGERLKRGAGRRQTAVERQRDPEIVDAERRVKELLLAGSEIPPALAAKAEILLFGKAQGRLQRPGDLLALKNVRRLALSELLFEPEEIIALGQLSKLTNLSVQVNSASHLSALGQLSNLSSLSVLVIYARDISALGKLSNLTTLSIQANNVRDISALGTLTNLTNLSVQANNANDISALGKLTNLTGLSVHAVYANSISALGQLTNLTSLSVHASNARDISALGKLTNLTSLSVQTNNTINISALAQLSNLTSLTVQANKASDISALGRLTNLTSLSVQVNAASDISALGNLLNLTSLSVQANNASDISALGKLSNLTSLSVQANAANDISALGKLSNLTNLSVNANNARDFSSLWRLLNLTSLTLQGMTVNLSGISQLKYLAQIRIASARNVDLAPLVAAKSLKKLILTDVSFRNSESLKSIEIEVTGNSRHI